MNKELSAIFDKVTSEIFWWNMGKRKLDHRGTATEYLNKRDIKVSAITRKDYPDVKGFRFKIAVSSVTITADVYSDATRAAHEACKLFLSAMGDKALCKTGYLTTQVNWR